MKSLLATLLLSLALSGGASAATYQIDGNHTQVHFTYGHGGYSNLSGRLTGAGGQIDFDPADPAKASVQVELPMASLSTGVPKLDAHLSSADFFDVAKFPTASFKSTTVTVVDDAHLRVDGDLSLHGVTRPVSFEVTINSTKANGRTGMPALGLDARTTIRRSEFGVDGMLGAVPDEVELHLSLEARVPKPPVADDAAAAPAAGAR